MSQNNDVSKSKTLHCFGQAEVTEPLRRGWEALETFSTETAQNFWKILTSFLAEPGHPSHENTLEDFREKNGLERQALVDALETCDALISGASTLNLRESLLHEDVQVLAGRNSPRCIEFVQQYGSLRPFLQKRNIEATLTDHGKLLVGLDWRLDRVEASGRGNQLDASVLFLSLSYQEGNEVEKVSLQVNEEGLRMLKSFTDRFSTAG